MSCVPWAHVADVCVQRYPKRGEKGLVIDLFFQVKIWNKDSFLLGSFIPDWTNFCEGTAGRPALELGIPRWIKTRVGEKIQNHIIARHSDEPVLILETVPRPEAVWEMRESVEAGWRGLEIGW